MKDVTLTFSQLRDPSLLKDKCYVNGTWIGASSGKTFNVDSTVPISQPPP